MTDNHYQRYQNDVANTASQMIAQAVCAEKGMDYSQVLQMAQQNHINGILQQEQMKMFQQVLSRHYNGNTFVGKLREVFGSSSPSFFPMMGMGMPMMNPMTPLPSPIQTVQPLPSSPSAETEQLKKEVEDIKKALQSFLQSQSNPV